MLRGTDHEAEGLRANPPLALWSWAPALGARLRPASTGEYVGALGSGRDIDGAGRRAGTGKSELEFVPFVGAAGHSPEECPLPILTSIEEKLDFVGNEPTIGSSNEEFKRKSGASMDVLMGVEGELRATVGCACTSLVVVLAVELELLFVVPSGVK